MINKVIDISHYNGGTLDFIAAKNDGIKGVIHKATEGTRFVDPTMKDRSQAIVDAGLLLGFYHFGTGDDPVHQADFFLSQVDVLRKPNDPILLVLDFEHNPTGASMVLRQAQDFILEVKNAGLSLGLYGGSYLREELLVESFDSALLQSCFLWVAQYTTISPRVPSPWSGWSMWQYTNGAAGNPPYEVAGIGRCDRDMFNGDEDQLDELWGVVKP